MKNALTPAEFAFSDEDLGIFAKVAIRPVSQVVERTCHQRSYGLCGH